MEELAHSGIGPGSILNGNPTYGVIPLSQWYQGRPAHDVFIVQTIINGVFGTYTDAQARCDLVFGQMMEVAQVALANGTPKVVLWTPPPVANFSSLNAIQAAMHALITDKVKAVNGPDIFHFDVQPVLDTTGDGAIDANKTPDNVHPNALGYQCVADAMAEFLTAGC